MRKIKFYRLNSEKTQREIAKEIGCTQALISMFETGKVIPGKKFKEAIAEALNRPEDEIFPREDNNE
jgi:transcriptional regulator with XRE-family HTH domain